MWIIVSRYPNGDVVYYGPFEGQDDAWKALEALRERKPYTRNHVAMLTRGNRVHL